jgi:muconate cycloisomerase/chloromuconate cycloisomerase
MSKLRVKALEAIIVDLPLRRLQRFAAIGARNTSVVVVRIQTNEGIEGIGEAVTPSGPWWGGESVESIKLVIDQYLSPLVLEADPFATADLAARWNRAVYGNTFAKAAVEMALLDVQGKFLNMPLYELLGGKRREALPCSWPLATGDASAEIDEALAMVEAKKFRLFKLKMGAIEPARDVERACTVARGLAGKALVRADPNEMWDEATAKWAVPRMADAGIDMVEQPISRHNMEGSARLTQSATCAIMLDEGVCTAQDMLRITQLRAADLVSLKIMKTGGILATRRIADIAEAGGVSLYMGTFLESSIGTAANMQLCATFPDLPYGGELSGAGLIAEDLAIEPAVYKDYELQLPKGVGIAVQLDEDKVKAFRRDRSYMITGG